MKGNQILPDESKISIGNYLVYARNTIPIGVKGERLVDRLISFGCDGIEHVIKATLVERNIDGDSYERDRYEVIGRCDANSCDGLCQKNNMGEFSYDRLQK